MYPPQYCLCLLFSLTLADHDRSLCIYADMPLVYGMSSCLTCFLSPSLPLARPIACCCSVVLLLAFGISSTLACFLSSFVQRPSPIAFCCIALVFVLADHSFADAFAVLGSLPVFLLWVLGSLSLAMSFSCLSLAYTFSSCSVFRTVSNSGNGALSSSPSFLKSTLPVAVPLTISLQICWHLCR